MQTNESQRIANYQQQSLKYSQQLGILGCLNGYLIDIILSYCCDLEELQKNKLVCKFFAALILQRLSIITCIYDQAGPLKNNTEKYCVILDIPKCIKILYGIKVEIWIPYRKSYVQYGTQCSPLIRLRIIGTENRYILASDDGQQINQKLVKRIDQLKDHEFLSQCQMGQQIGLYSICAHPAWQIHIKKAKISLFYSKNPDYE